MKKLSFREKLQALKESQSKKVFPCPSCGKKLRIPIRIGKTLVVSCPNCRGQIQIRFPSPKEQFKMLFRNSLKMNYKKVLITLIFILGISYWIYWYQNLGQ